MVQKISVLAVDDEPDLRASFCDLFADAVQIIPAASGAEALQLLKTHDISVVMLDIEMPQMNGFEALKRIKAADPSVEVIMMTVLNDAKLAVDALKLGAFSYLTKPVNYETTLHTIKQAARKRNLGLQAHVWKDQQQQASRPLVGASENWKQVLGLVEKCGKGNVTVLITGETGTGKEVIARNIHEQGVRAAQPFVSINCAALPKELIEAELFGYEKGAFTGALEQRPGKFELAHEGTLFLDEIARLPLDLQPKLLRVLQERSFQRVGGAKDIQVDVQIIAASNQGLRKMMEAGVFLPDLYYRLNVVEIPVLPLRERPDDVPALALYFLKLLNREYAKSFEYLSPEVIEALQSYGWPGNVRELENCLRRMVVLEDGQVLLLKHLPKELADQQEPLGASDGALAEGSLQEKVATLEKKLILEALDQAEGNRAKAARLLQMKRTTLLWKLEHLAIK